MIPDCEYIDTLYANLKKLKPNQWYSIDMSRRDYKEFIATLKILVDVGEGIKIRNDYRAFKCVTEKEDFLKDIEEVPGVEFKKIDGGNWISITIPCKNQDVKKRVKEVDRVEVFYEGKLIAIY
jgi:hypothetical protein